MEKNTLAVGALMLIVGLGLGYLFTGGEIRGGGQMMPGGGMMSQTIDQHFIVQMIPHHEGAIEMSKIALERSKRPEVLALARAIIDAQQKEITDMSTWYQAWFGEVPPEGGMGMMHMGGMEGDTARLKSMSDAEFDREFLVQMIPHHEMAIMMAQMLQGSTQRSEMKTLAENIIASQAREIDMMRGWLKSWYDVQ